MKPKTLNISKILIMLYFIGFIFTPVSSFASDKSVKLELNQLTAQLSLTESQVAEVERILNMVNSQAEKDREVFKDNPEALIGAAKRRHIMTNNLILPLLNQEQAAKFNAMNKDRNKDLEFVTWKEGLSLNEVQCLRVKEILNKTYQQIQLLKERYKDQPQTLDGMTDNTIHDRRNYNQGGVAGSGMGREPALARNLRAANNQKEREIKALLTPEQKQSFKKVVSILESILSDR